MEDYKESREDPTSSDWLWSISNEYVMEKIFCPEGIYPDPEPPPVLISSDLKNPPLAICCSDSFAVPPGMPHPLQNPLILMNMFDLCPPPLLANFRLVCKAWRDLSLTSWRSTVPVTFRLTQYGSLLTVGNKLFPFRKYVREYVDCPETQTDRKPFRTVRILSWHFDSAMARFSSFWNPFAQNLTSLEIKRCVFPNVDEFQRIIFKYCRNLKNLRLIDCIYQCRPSESALENVIKPKYEEPVYGIHVHMRTLHIETEMHKRPHICPVMWMELFSHFQNLNSFYFLVRQKCNSDMEAELAEYDCETLLKAIKAVRSNDRWKLPLKSLRILPFLDVSPSQDMFALLREVQLSLRGSPGLCFHLDPDTDPEVTSDILELFGKELKYFQVITKTDIQVPMYWVFPNIGPSSFEQLTMLTLRNVICERMGFLAAMPNLETLHMVNDLAPGLINLQHMALSNVKLLKMRKFTCEYMLTFGNLDQLVKMTPNLEILEMALRDSHFQYVCYYWRKLKGLKVIGDFLSDEGLTGRINLESQIKYRRRVLPGITLLQDLEYCSFNRNNRLTDTSAHYGLFHLPNLRRVQVCPHPEFSEEVRKEFWQRDVKLLGVNGNLAGDA